MIHKVYTSPREQHAMRHFCGFCGTPLSYWSEEPRTEANYIQLALGSLCSEDLGDLEDLGLLPDSDDEADETPGAPKDTPMAGTADDEVVINAGRETLGGLPWFDTMVQGSKLGNLGTTKGNSRSRYGAVRIEWEIVEYTEDDGDDAPRPGKRKLDDGDDSQGASAMSGVQQ